MALSEVQSQTQPSRPLSATPPLALLPDGTQLKGTFQKMSDSEVVAYKGIRYAHPPIDDLRWKSPVGPFSYNETKPVDCTAFGGEIRNCLSLSGVIEYNH